MKRVFLIILSLSLVLSNLSAGAAMGKLIYDKKLRAGCGITAGEMSRKHTARRWRFFYKNKLLSKEISRICPDVKPITKPNELKNLYHLFSTFAKGSGNTVSN